MVQPSGGPRTKRRNVRDAYVSQQGLSGSPAGSLTSVNVLANLNRERGLTIIMVTHEPDMAAYARRLVHFLDGRIAADVPGKKAA